MTRLYILGAFLVIVGAAWLVAANAVSLADAFRYQHVDLAELAKFPLSSESGRQQDVPAAVRAMEGRNVRVEGFLSADFRSDAERSFALTSYERRPDVTRPSVTDWMVVTVRPTTALPSVLTSSKEAITGRLSVRGTLHVQVIRDTDGVTGVFSIDAAECAARGD